ncbi:MAG: hypothetical protein J6K62_01940 [Clostridia bacterium]|nr:hypothetical protein [Clostridia bacterium]
MFELYLMILLLGSFPMCALSFIDFIDVTGLLEKLMNLMLGKRREAWWQSTNPNIRRNIEQFKENARLQKSAEYKAHKKKWRRWFLLIPAAYFVVCTILFPVLPNKYLVFCLGLTAGFITYGVLHKRESAQRKSIEEKLK